MKKKFVCLMLTTICAFALTGCFIPTLPDMTEEQEALVTEYAAGLILKYSPSYSSSLLDDEELAQAEEEEEEQRQKEEKSRQLAEEYLAKTASKDTKQDDATEDGSREESTKTQVEATDITVDNIADFYGIEGFTVSYDGYELGDSYSDGGIISVSADSGKNLYIVHFNITNQGSGDAEFDIFDIDAKFQLSVNGAKKITADSTMLLDDLASYKDTIPAGQTVPVVLLFEVDDSVSPESLQLFMTGANGSGTMALD